MDKLTIDVTQEDINKGRRRKPNSCPIARAFKRAMRGTSAVFSPRSVRVEVDHIRWNSNGARWFAWLHGQPRVFIRMFDNFFDEEDIHPAPFTFQLPKQDVKSE